MNQYESMYIIDAALEDQARKDLIDKFAGVITSNGGEILRIDEWGRRRLAYQIDYKTEGFYVLAYFNGPADLPKELERNYAINEGVLRYLTVRFEGTLPPKREPLRPAQSAPAQVEATEGETAAPAPEAPEAEATAPVDETPGAEATAAPADAEQPVATDDAAADEPQAEQPVVEPETEA